jgi:putative FmdB family regulatory protein
MPIYEYRCQNCRKRVSVFLRSFTSTVDPVCDRCGGKDLSRLVSLVSVVKSEESRLEELADPGAFGDLDENDPKSIAQWARRMGREMGEDLGPEFDEMVDQLEAGEMPEDLDGDMGDEGDGGFGGGLGGDFDD